MGTKLKKKDIVDSIKKQLEKCLEYQKKDPDKAAAKRVELLEKNPVKLGKFYVNVTLKSPDMAKVTNLDERLKRLQSKKYLCTIDDMEKVYETGVVIDVKINETSLQITPQIMRILQFANVDFDAEVHEWKHSNAAVEPKEHDVWKLHHRRRENCA